ncbi:hypothetical protein DPMN_155280 [Dreissena polymorpha]|uniref:Uncharacterized protein n=1 Tax=Dreissena polymorpha TaxID=45954 RepID=A0A9D4FML3_DREPO|nr:hypothetical protein DPMN_155280 [Dreissena polymorpha]
MRPVICPPLNICWHIYDLVQRVCCRQATVEDPFRVLMGTCEGNKSICRGCLVRHM